MQAVILAAGACSRFWPLNYQHKTLIKVCGRPLISFLIDDLRKVGVKDIIIVQSLKKKIEKELADKNLRYVFQNQPTGTGDSVLVAEKLIKNDKFFILNADDKMDIKNNFTAILKKSDQKRNKLILLASKTKTPWLFGILRMKNKKVMEIIEKPLPGREPSNLKNDNLFLVPSIFLKYLKKVPSHPFSLINAINLYARENPIEAVLSKRETISLKMLWDIFSIMEAKLASPAFKSKIEKSAALGKNIVISGKVYIGKKSKIGPNTTIYGPCYIGDNCRIGANNVLRGPLNIEDRVQTGAFMEIKHSLIQEGAHFHSGYVGDSLIGPDCRFGAGFISANRRMDRKNIFSTVKGKEIDTGLAYFGTAIGRNTRIGIGVGVMPGVFIGSDCVIGPGSVIFENVSDNSKVITRFYTQILKSRKK